MMIIPKRNCRVCTHCGHICKKEELKQSISVSKGAYDICPSCSCPVKEIWSNDLLDNINADVYFQIVMKVNERFYRDKEEIDLVYNRYNIAESLRFYGEYK